MDSRSLTGAGPSERGNSVGSVIKKRRKRMAKKKHRKLLKRTRVQRRNKK
ncbi:MULTISPECIES: 30S ribosomal protein bS22 [Kitasatospora]